MLKQIKILDMVFKNKQKYLKNKSLGFNKFANNKRRVLKRFLRVKVGGRPFLHYKFFKSSTDHVYVSINVCPNNMFCTVQRGKRFGKAGAKYRLLMLKTSGNFGVKLTKKGLKARILNVLSQCLKGFKQLDLRDSDFLVFNIVAPMNLRKRIVQFLNKSLLRTLFLKRKVVLNFDSKKVFNGCMPCKQRRKKRKGFRILK